MLIGIDLDSVLADITVLMNQYVNRTFHTTYTIDDYTDYNLTLIWGCSNDEVYERIYSFYKSDDMDKIQPIPGSVQGIDFLKQNHKLIVITSRPEITKLSTTNWINTYFPNIFEDIVLSSQFAPDGYTKKTKGQIGKELGINAMIDDHIGYIEDCIRYGIKSYLFEAPWNKNKQVAAEIIRMADWSDARKFF